MVCCAAAVSSYPGGLVLNYPSGRGEQIGVGPCLPAKEVLLMFRTIVVPLDGSAQAERALPYARRLAQASRGRLVLVRAHVPSDKAVEAERQLSRSELQAAVDGARRDGFDVEARFVEGRAADVIYEAAGDVRADLIVMSTHGRSGIGRWLYGSVADEVLRRMPVPVVLVTPRCAEAWSESQPPTVLVPLDGSGLSATVLEPATRLARALSGELTLLSVVEPVPSVLPDALVQEIPDPVRDIREARAYLEQTAASIRESDTGMPVSLHVAYGEAAESIVGTARERHVHAIALATHGRGGLTRLLLGSVATSTLRLTDVPVLVYRPTTVPTSAMDRAIEAASVPAGIGA